MSDMDQTVVSKGGADQLHGAPQSPPPQEKKRNPLLIIGGIGCALLLCLGLLLGGGFWLAGDRISELMAGVGAEVETPTLAPTVEADTTPPPTEEAPPDEQGAPPEPTQEPTETTAPADTPSPETAGEPSFGMITFALGATDTYDPVDPGTTFEEGITEIHAIFDYTGMSPTDTWERVWYLDGTEVLRNSATWNDQSSGRFDYFIDAGGDPLLPGEWNLELYVNDKLLSTGTFTIEAEETEAAQATPTPEPEEEPTATPTSTTASGSGSSGGGTYRLAFTRWDGGQHNLYLADTNGNNEQFIMNRAAGPSWTPDGATIFMYGSEGVDRQDRSSFPNVESCPLDGISNGIVQVEVPSPPADICIAKTRVIQGRGWNEGTARWANVSPDGQMVAYDAKPGGDYRIYFLGTADNQQFNYQIIGEQADWSPDSQKVVYRSGRDGVTGIWISNRDDSGHTNITQGGSDSFPAWSPDGRSIAFSRDEGGNVDIYVMNVDGSNIRRLTDAPGPDTLPVYTPSGDIIFRSARTGSWSVWKMSGSGGNQTEIIANAGVGPDWAFSRMDVK